MSDEEIQEAKQILHTLLTKLGFECEIEVQGEGRTAILNVTSPDQELLTGRKGDRLDDLQYLVNRILRKKFPEADRIRVDSGGYRQSQEEEVADRARKLATKVKQNGKEIWMNAMNSYHRRLVHNALSEDSEVETVSEETNKRDKKILIRLK